MLSKHRRTKSDTDSLFPKNHADYLLNLLIQEKNYRLIHEYIRDRELKDPHQYWQVILTKRPAKNPKTNQQWKAISPLEYAAITKNEHILDMGLLANLPNNKEVLTEALEQLQKIEDHQFTSERIESLKRRIDYYFKP